MTLLQAHRNLPHSCSAERTDWGFHLRVNASSTRIDKSHFFSLFETSVYLTIRITVALQNSFCLLYSLTRGVGVEISISTTRSSPQLSWHDPDEEVAGHSLDNLALLTQLIWQPSTLTVCTCPCTLMSHSLCSM